MTTIYIHNDGKGHPKAARLQEMNHDDESRLLLLLFTCRVEPRLHAVDDICFWARKS